MTDARSLKRQEFLRRSTAAGLAGTLSGKALFAAGDSIEEAAQKVGRLPLRKLGYSGREASVLIGAGDLASAPAEAAILKDQDAPYYQVTADRIGGNHETGRIDEETHYDFVKEILRHTGLGYFDDMQLPYGYHNKEEVRSNRGFVRAGLPNRRPRSGNKQVPELRPREGLRHHSHEDRETYSGAGKRLRDGDVRAIEMMMARADMTACRLCTECQPHCPQNVPIAEILRFERYALDDGDRWKARALYHELENKADACVACGTCLAHCPQELAIPDKLAAVHSLLSRR